jgi:uncharacterized protein (TIRG00374 family)
MIVFLWIAVSYFAQTKHILTVLAQGQWYWVLMAVIIQLFYYPFYAYFVEGVFKIFKVKLLRKQILPIYLASKFTDVALPVATLGQVAIFVRNGKRNGNEPLNVGIGISFVLLFELVAFAILASAVMVTLSIFDHPPLYMIYTLLILVFLLLLALLFIVRVAIQQKPLNKLFLLMIKVVAKFAGQKNVNISHVHQIIQETGADLRTNLEMVWPSLRLAICTHLLNLVTFAIIFIAFANTFNILAILAGYVACLLFTVVSITPQGVGVAETAMISTLTSFGLDFSVAAVITLAFRGLLYWLPFFPGFYVFSRLELKSEE